MSNCANLRLSCRINNKRKIGFCLMKMLRKRSTISIAMHHLRNSFILSDIKTYPTFLCFNLYWANKTAEFDNQYFFLKVTQLVCI